VVVHNHAIRFVFVQIDLIPVRSSLPILVLLFVLFRMIAGDIISRDIGNSGSFDSSDNVGWWSANDTDGIKTGNVVDYESGTTKMR
jgi:hypothetical protein